MPRAAPRIHATVTVVGKDRTGVVARVTAFLFESGTSIEHVMEEFARGRFPMAVQTSEKDAESHVLRAVRPSRTRFGR